MKYFFILFIGLISQISFAQTKMAFVNVNAVVDSCMKYNGSAEEIRMMETILSKKEEELKQLKKDASTSEEVIKTLEGDIAEYKNRIEARRKEIAANEEKENTRNIYLQQVKKKADQLTKKKKYSEYFDISNGKPVNYKVEDDLTNEVWLKLK